MAEGGGDDIVQRIVLTGNEEVIAAFLAMQEAGTRAFEAIGEAAKSLAGIDEAVAKVKETAAAVQEAQAGVKEAQEALAASQAATSAATVAGFEEQAAAIKKLEEAQAGLAAAEAASAEATAGRFTGGLKTAALAIVGVVAAVSIAVTGLFEFAKGASETEHELKLMSERFGDTAENTDAFLSSMAEMGVKTDELGQSFRRMAVQIENSWTQIQRESRESADKLKGDLLSVESAQLHLADAQQKASNVSRDIASERIRNALSVADAQQRLDDVQTKALKNSGVDTSFIEQQNEALKEQREYIKAIQDLKDAKAKKADFEAEADRKAQEAALAAEKANLDLNNARRKQAEDAGNDINNVTDAVKKLGQGEPDALKGINASAENIVHGIVNSAHLGVASLGDLKGSISDLSTPAPKVKDVIEELSRVFQHLDDNGLKTAIAVRLFGRAVGQDLIEALSQGPEKVKQMQEHIKSLGLTINDADIASGKAFRTSFISLEDTVEHLANKVSTQLQPPFTLAFNAINHYFEENGQSIIKWANGLAQNAIPTVESFARVLSGVPDAAKDAWLTQYVEHIKAFGDAMKGIGTAIKDVAAGIGEGAHLIAEVLNGVFGTNLNTYDVLFGAFVLRITGGFALMGQAATLFATIAGTSLGPLVATLGTIALAVLAVKAAYDQLKNATPDTKVASSDEIGGGLGDLLTDNKSTVLSKKLSGESDAAKGTANEGKDAFKELENAHKKLVESHAHDTQEFIANEGKKAQALLDNLAKEQEVQNQRKSAHESAVSHAAPHTDEHHPNLADPHAQEARRQEVAALSGGSAVAGEGASVRGAGFGASTKEVSPLTEPSKNLDSAAGKLSGAADQLVKGSQKDLTNVQREASRGVHTVEGDQALRDAGKFDRNNIDGREIKPPAVASPSDVGLPTPLDDQFFQHKRDVDRAQQFNRDIARQGGEPSPDKTYSDRPIPGHYDDNGGFVRDRKPPTAFEQQNTQTGAPAPVSFSEQQTKKPESVPLPQPRPAEANPAPPIVQAIHESGDKVVQAITQPKSGSAPPTEPPSGSQEAAQQTSLLQNILSAISTLRDSLHQGDQSNGAAQSEEQLKTSADEASQGLTGFQEALQGLSAAIQSMTAAMQAATTEAGAGTAGFAGGGHVQGAGTGTSDSIPAALSHGEYVHTAKAVDHYGVGFMHAVNNLRLPRFNLGGLVGFGFAPATPLAAFAGGGLVAGPTRSGGSSGGHMTVDLRTNAGNFDGLIAPDHVAKQMSRAAVQRQNVQTGNKPGWYKGKS